MRVVGIVSAVLAAAISAQAWALAAGETFPQKLRIAHMTGAELSPDGMSGKVTVINFWATWCKACKVELKEMESLLAPLLKDPNFRFAFVSLDKDPAQAQAWVTENLKLKDFMATLHKDPEFAAANELGVDAFPMTFVIDQKGKVTKVQRGFEEGKGLTEGLIAEAKSLLLASPR